ncbi:sulfate/molybdate ABC transporter ATP-binding protein [Fimbriiglobus ruber]|uniref:Sulfate and thiosulfate import ATP-binding protein CysA n=1 Tax=Fimbriiglobus ruber TaxID=1908690 RepID=A0A225EAM0_9BACT|nr:sulfate/molybdate ABC transporter ATP-binding protein [Fimbriiglobus ruber]OWK45605.1 Sulfate and thiosulfate import ATP-binding protein CysA [Fimbriiglobus ruber]
MSITAKNIWKRFDGKAVLRGVTVEAPTGALVALLGPSGSGKTTLLRIIAGLEVADSGAVQFHDDDITRHSARDRNMGFVFQHYALFRHMTVFENVAFGLRVRRWPEQKVRDRVHELLNLVKLPEMAARYPAQMSGGQRQRIALARALAPEPKVILLDEPFGALDAQVREELRHWLRRFHDQFHVTSIFVTHDQEEAFEVADRVIVMHDGKVEQAGTPAEVFEHPVNEFVMKFLGRVNVFQTLLKDGRVLLGNVEMPVGKGAVVETGSGKADVYVRPHELDIGRTADTGNCIRGKVVHINPAGSVVKVRVHAEDFGLMVNVDISPEKYRSMDLRADDQVFVSPKTAKIFEPDYTI